MKQIIFRFLFGVLVFMTGGLVQAQVAQTPLIVGGVSVPPNLVFTFDDSGSMFFECLPEALCIGTSYVGTMPGGFGTFKNGVATTTSNNLFNRQMRSAATNVTYYNPAITYSPWLKSDGTSYPTYPANAAPIDPRVPGTTLNLISTQTFTTNFCTGPSSGNCSNSAQSFYPAQYFNLTSGSGTVVGNFTQVVITGTAATTFPKGTDRTDCGVATITVCTLAQEQQNFANWFTYYRNKLVAAIGGTATAFYNLPVSYRLGYGRINQPSNSIDGTNSGTLVRGLRSFTGADRDAFYTWLFTLQPDPGGTPLRRAMGDVGEYYSRSDSKGPWGAVPGTADATAQLTCRRSFHLLMTDGSWTNGAAYAASNSAANGNVDNTSLTTPVTGPNGQSYAYTAAAPYRDSYSGTLADVAMYYWSKDLRPDLANEVKPTAGDPAFWQHMVNYTIGFGVNGNLVNPDDLAALTAGTKSWGDPTGSNDNNKVDDLWHAAVNSRGLSLSAADQQAYANALRAVISNIDERNGSDAGVAVSGRFLSSTSRKYVPEYRTNAWTGELSAVSLDSNGNDATVVWRASEHLPAAAARNIFTFKDTTTKGISFTWASLTAQSMTATLGVSAAAGPGLVNYLRGDATGEGTTYRVRAKKLGDIINSSPSLVKDTVDMQYDFLPSTTGTTGTSVAKYSYREFLRNKSFRVAQVFVGANDGMLHAFSDVNGTETFAFMPRAVLGKVNALSQTPYDHQYYVDGPTIESDVFDSSLGTTGGWRNLVIASGGAGAKNIFAINVPVPSSPTGSGTLTTTLMPPGASDILWENTNTGTFAELGYLMQTAEVGLMRNGQWAVIVGNGYESASGRAQLFVIDALTGALIKRIDTGIPVAGGGNGLSGVRVIRDLQQRIVAAYAGDLMGNLWKFDFSSTSSANWAVAFGSTASVPKPLFSAVNRNGQTEPFTAAPTYAVHPAGGTLVLAGTGKLFETADTNNTQERTLYGLWDQVKVGDDSSASTYAIAGTATLVLQQISVTVTVSAGSPTQSVTYYTSTNNTVDYATKRGWRLPMTVQAGERMIYDPQVALGRVFFETIVPGAAVQTCQATSGIGFNFVLDPFSGAAGTGPTFDTNGDGFIDNNDLTSAVGYQTGADGSDGILIKRGGTSQGVTVSPNTSRLFQGNKNSIRRTWRQIFSPPSS
ncbi:MAG: PilC/PilY family type IV pilus protein [Pseudomonadota bacterium]